MTITSSKKGLELGPSAISRILDSYNSGSRLFLNGKEYFIRDIMVDFYERTDDNDGDRVINVDMEQVN